MDIRDLKEEILNREFLTDILFELGCHHIQDRGDYLTCGNPDGDNPRSVVVYKNEYISCTNYTRQITKNSRAADIFDLIAYIRDCSFAEAMKFVCELMGLEYYGERTNEPESLQILRLLRDMSIGDDGEDNTRVKPISEKILSYYLPYGSKMWEDSGVSLATQRFFELSFDPCTNSVAIPIRDELGTLVAVKARRLEYNPSVGESKYFFLEPGSKSLVLYGLYQNLKLIQEQGVVYVGESERFVHQLYEMGYYGVSTGGSKVSRRQVEMLTRLGVKIVFCFDKDQTKNDIENVANMFLDGISIYAMLDEDNVLIDKESPSDDSKKWIYMVNNNIYIIR